MPDSHPCGDKIGSPYPGLRPFRDEEAGIFFGREEQVDHMLTRLETHHFMAVVGTSGCGKSSLVRAGLIPVLEQGLLCGAYPNWRIAVMRPGDAPFECLATALLESKALRERGDDPRTAAFLQATLRRGPLGLWEAIQETHLPAETNVLLVVDQFEEIFRYRQQVDNVNDADAFVNLLVASARPPAGNQTQQNPPLFIIITMRSDFIGDCALFIGLPELVR
ncbi:MAG: ATP-binding protein [Chromatiales bacterium]|nr:ATP-binding protein [Chromatiales bacterium]